MTDEVQDLQAELVQAQRLAEALEALERGEDPAVDPREDPELAGLLSTVGVLGERWQSLAPSSSYAARSRAFIVHSMESRVPTSRALVAQPAVPPKALPFYRRWSLLTPLASAAAAAAVTLTVVVASSVGGNGGGDAAQPEAVAALPAEQTLPEPERPPIAEAAAGASDVENLTSRGLVAELQRIESVLRAIEERNTAGRFVEAPLLRGLTEQTTSLASQIDNAPEDVPGHTVVTFIQAAAASRAVLENVRVAPDDEAALVAAQQAAQDGVVVASRFITRVGGISE